MNIQLDAQTLMEEQKTGISWTAYNIIEHLAKANSGNALALNYFDIFNLSEACKSISKMRELGYSLNVCKWFDSRIYKLIYNFIPVPYSLFFGNGADITHFMNYHVPPGVKGKVVTMVYDMVYKTFPETMNVKTRTMLNLSMERSCRRADRIITISQFSKDEIIKYLNVPSEKIVVMPCGIDFELYRPGYSEEEISSVKNKFSISGEYFLYLGTLEPRKNIERLIDSYYLLSQRRKEIPMLVIAGRKGWQYGNIFQKVNLLNLQKKILFTGYIDAADSPLLMSGAAAFVFPSLYEGFGLPPLEAMACGTPVITSNTASLPEVAGEAAIAVDPYSVESIADGMDKILSSEIYREELSHMGLEHSSAFSWDNSVKVILDVYEHLRD